MWTPVTTADGSVTLRCPRTGALAHSAAGAWTEARERYVCATRLAERPRPVRVLDVGTGLGWNLAAALDAADPLEVVTLELDPAPIEAALGLAVTGGLGPPDIARHHEPVARALREALHGSGEPVPFGGGHLRLLLGDARRTLPALGPDFAFDVVFLDPFAPGEDPPLWEAGFLGEVARRLAPGGLLSTYSASLTVRARLANAGLRVGSGPRVGEKAQGTLASPDLVLPALDARTQRKLARRLGQETGSGP
jgi:predicted O-methyltransferase YrrM